MSGEPHRDEPLNDGGNNGGDGKHSHDFDAPSDSPPLPSGPFSPGQSQMAATSAPPHDGNHDGLQKVVEDVMQSDIGIITLLNRLKQSIASARDFASFLKKRSSLEEEQSVGMKRLAGLHLEATKRSDLKSGSYAAQLTEAYRVHQRIADNGMQFALSLHQMHEDLNELSINMERGRKQWKHDGLDAEKRASDAESAMQKAKARYDSLAEDYDRARTGDSKGSRRIGLKGPKSAEQHEQDLLKKVQTADADYEEKVKLAQQQRSTLFKSERPRAVKALHELITECDAGITLQLQKFAAFNEKLLLGNGLAITPFSDKDTPSAQKSLRDVIMGIDNSRDFNSYVGSQASKMTRPTEIKYEQYSTLAPKTQIPNQRSVSGPIGAPVAQSGFASPSTSQPNSMSNRFGAQPSPGFGHQSPLAGNPVGQPAPNVPPHGHLAQPSFGSPAAQQLPFMPGQSGARDGFAAPGGYAGSPAPGQPPQSNDRNGSFPQSYNNAGSFGQSSRHQAQPSSGGAPQQTSHSHLPPLRPVFGVTLDELFQRDQMAVPIVVMQSILAVDTFGLDVEGIYRLSGSQALINSLKQQFNHNPSAVDFRNPATFQHDINAVATLLKNFFRDLPDPLFTTAGYQKFIDAAKNDDDTQRRDALHQAINDLPDPNYATLRSLVLHLHRVMQHESRNRMSSSNLAVCFAPSLMGTHTGSQIADAGLQARVLDTILLNATAIFDED